MASKKAAVNENPKITKKGFFRRSESVMPNSYDKNMTADTADVDTLDSDSKKQLIRRSSMICSEGFDKYTFDCHRHDIPVRSAGLDLEVTATPEEPSQNQTSLVPENNVISSAQNSKPSATEHFNKPPAVEQFNIKKLTSFKPVSAVSPSIKSTPFSFKRVPEETIPPNIPLSNKRVPEETIPVNRAISFDIPSNKSPVTNIPLSFNPIPEETKWINNTSPKTSMNKSAPVTTTPFSFRHISDESSPIRNAPLSFRRVPEELPRPVNRAFSFRSVSGQSDPFRNVFSQSEPVRNTPLSFKPVSQEFMPARNAPLSVKHVPEKTGSSSYAPLQTISDETIPHRNSPLSLKHVSVENMRNTSSSFHHFPNKPVTPVRDIPLSFEPVPEEPMPVRNSPLALKDVPDEPIPSRNAPLFLKPILTKHMSLLKKKTPSVRSAIIKRDSVVHPERVDMQNSLCIDGRFQNPWPTWRPPTFTNILKFGVTRNKSKVPPKQELDLVLPIVKQNFSKLTVPDDGIRVTWIGHSTVLIQMHNLNILTDPMFSDRASPSQVVGPKRYRDPPCSIHDLPHINAVVISHSHYDHLDSNTITLLNARFGADIRWFVPLGLQTWMEHVGCENVVELDWWEENCVPEHSDISFIFTPAQHWSKRTIGDDNKVLWGSWCILGPQYRFFFAGDTGYCDVFKQIGRVHGPFDLCAIPIGAYEPRWFMKYQHVNPEEAVQIHMDVKSKRSLAIHWGTFCLANEYYLDPPVKLREALDKNEIPPELFFTLKHGESRLIAQNNLVKRNPLSDKNTSNS